MGSCEKSSTVEPCSDSCRHLSHRRSQEPHRPTKLLTLSQSISSDHVVRIVPAVLALALPVTASFKCCEADHVAAVPVINFIDDLAQVVTSLEIHLLEQAVRDLVG